VEGLSAGLSRRRFVVGSLSLPAAALGGPVFGPGVTARPGQRDPALASWGAVRARFRLDPSLTHFASFILASHPEPVRRAIALYRAALDADPFSYESNNSFAREEEVAAAAAAYLGTDPNLIALTDSTTMGLGLVYRTFALDPGDEVLTTEHDHYSTHESLRLRAVADGVAVRKVRLYPPLNPEVATAAGIVDALRQAITPATRVVAVTWVHSSSGVKLPLRQIADAVAAANAARPANRRIALVVDGVHALGAEWFAVEQLGCDVLVAGCHKWLWGPRGTGLVWARPWAWERMSPVIPSFHPAVYGAWIAGNVPSASPSAMMTPGGFHSFEHRWALPEAFAFHTAIGPERIERRTLALSRRLREGIADVPGLRLRSPGGPLASGVVCLEVAGRSPNDVVGALRSRFRIVASVTPYAVQFVRVGTSVLNTRREVDELVRALSLLRS
jgi:selenocysteine lyase/cysteine desulfurase